MSEDRAQTFVPISPDISNGPGKETNPLFRNYGTLTTIAPAGKSTGTIYAGTDDGNLWYTHDQSNPEAWTKADDPDLPKAWITRVEVDRRNPQVAYVSYSGFRSGDDAAYLLRTTDGGVSWDDITGDLPRAPVNDINVIGDALFVASDFGVFVTRDAGASWLKVGGNLPLAPIFELRHHPGSNRLYAGTFGRSIWSIDLADLEAVPAEDKPAAPIVPETTPPPGVTPQPPQQQPGARRPRRRGYKRANLGLPSAKRCVRGTMRFRIRSPKRVRLAKVSVFVRGRLVATRRVPKHRRMRVVLRGLRGAFTVRVVATTRRGRKLQQSRRYTECALRVRP